MNRSASLFLAFICLIVLSSTALAAPLPYPNAGTVAPTHTFTAVKDGVVRYTFIDSPVVGDDFLGMIDLTTGRDSGLIVESKNLASGDVVSLGRVNAGDQLEFYLKNSNPYDAAQTFTSDPATSTDGYNHFYAYTLAGGQVYLGAEDIPQGQWWGGFTYADLNGKVSDVTISSVDPVPTPEPGTLGLMGTGLLGAAGFVRRRLSA